MRVTDKRCEHQLANPRPVGGGRLVEYDIQERVVGKIENKRTGKSKRIFFPWRTVAYEVQRHKEG